MTSANADIVVRDDSGNKISLSNPAKRIISLAPNITELLFAAGAGEQVVGVAQYSDYPPAAKKIRRIGGHDRFDLEAIVALKPDLVVAWGSGNASRSIDKLRSLGLTVFVTEPSNIMDMSANILALGILSGTQAHAEISVRRIRQEYTRLQTSFSQKPTVRVFYQVWHQPLMTVNGQHIISDVIRLCGGENVFSDLPVLSSEIGLEAVLAANPQVIVTGVNEAKPDWKQDWQKWKQLDAVAHGSLYDIDPDIMQRHTPRILQGAARLCRLLDESRGVGPE